MIIIVLLIFTSFVFTTYSMHNNSEPRQQLTSHFASPLHEAVHILDIDRVRQIVNEYKKAGISVDSIQDTNGQTPLWQAASFAGHEIIDMLIAAGGNINTQDKFGRTPLHINARYGNAPRIIYLLDRGARTDIATFNEKNTPLHEVAIELIRYNLSTTESLHVDNAKALLARGGADLLALKQHEGATPVDLAVKDGRLAILDMFRRVSMAHVFPALPALPLYASLRLLLAHEELEDVQEVENAPQPIIDMHRKSIIIEALKELRKAEANLYRKSDEQKRQEISSAQIKRLDESSIDYLFNALAYIKTYKKRT